jgi:tetratricopeptide (TPR) repeat protein
MLLSSAKHEPTSTAPWNGELIASKERPDTVATDNLALKLTYEAKYDEAEQLYRRLLHTREKASGKDHPDTLITVRGLASVLTYEEKYDEAKRMYRRLLNGQEKALGQAHPEHSRPLRILL